MDTDQSPITTDDPSDPCSLCMDQYDPPPRIYKHLHPRCEDLLVAYESATWD